MAIKVGDIVKDWDLARSCGSFRMRVLSVTKRGITVKEMTTKPAIIFYKPSEYKYLGKYGYCTCVSSCTGGGGDYDGDANGKEEFCYQDCDF